jgi:hypothetical protein
MPKEDLTSSDRSHQSLPQGGVELSLDELAKGLATGTLSRGKAIRWMGGALLGAALASFPGVAWADDDCRRLGRECRRDSQCCSRNCIRRGDDKVCGCPEGQTRCNDRCVNLQRNENHCGRCFNRCQTDQTCVGGVCCPDAQVCDTGPTLACCAVGEQCGEDGVCGPACVSDGGACAGDADCCNGFCNSNICGSCREAGGACPEAGRCCSDACVEGVACIPPGGGNLVECVCVNNTGGALFCSSAACGSSVLDQVCATVCAMHGGVQDIPCAVGGCS